MSRRKSILLKPPSMLFTLSTASLIFLMVVSSLSSLPMVPSPLFMRAVRTFRFSAVPWKLWASLRTSPMAPFSSGRFSSRIALRFLPTASNCWASLGSLSRRSALMASTLAMVWLMAPWFSCAMPRNSAVNTRMLSTISSSFCRPCSPPMDSFRAWVMPFTFLPMSAIVSMRLSRLTPALLGRGWLGGKEPLVTWPGSRSMNFSPRMPMDPRDTTASP